MLKSKCNVKISKNVLTKILKWSRTTYLAGTTRFCTCHVSGRSLSRTFLFLTTTLGLHIAANATSPAIQHTAAPDKMETNVIKENDQSANDPYHLLELPGELRNEIWSLALSYPEDVAIDCYTQKLLTPRPLALTLTCKQIRAECGDLIFRQNDLRLESSADETSYPPYDHLVENFCDFKLFLHKVPSKFGSVQIATEATGEGRYWWRSCGLHTWAYNLIKKCHTRKIYAAWLYYANVDGSSVAYSIPLIDQRYALAALERTRVDFEGEMPPKLQELHNSIKSELETVEDLFARKVKDRSWVS